MVWFKDYTHILYLTEKKYKLQDGYHFSDRKNNLTIISFYNWRHFTKKTPQYSHRFDLSVNNGLIYLICSLLGEFLHDPKSSPKDYCRNKNTGCIYDYLYEKGYINKGMVDTRICPDCEKKMQLKNANYKVIRAYLDLDF